MALIKCPECGKDISDKSKVCIHCGFPIEERFDNSVMEVNDDSKITRGKNSVVSTISISTKNEKNNEKIGYNNPNENKQKTKRKGLRVVSWLLIILILLFVLYTIQCNYLNKLYNSSAEKQLSCLKYEFILGKTHNYSGIDYMIEHYNESAKDIEILDAEEKIVPVLKIVNNSWVEIEFDTFGYSIDKNPIITVEKNLIIGRFSGDRYFYPDNDELKIGEHTVIFYFNGIQIGDTYSFTITDNTGIGDKTEIQKENEDYSTIAPMNPEKEAEQKTASLFEENVVDVLLEVKSYKDFTHDEMLQIVIDEIREEDKYGDDITEAEAEASLKKISEKYNTTPKDITIMYTIDDILREAYAAIATPKPNSSNSYKVIDRKDDDYWYAVTAAQNLVKEELKSPSTAKFPTNDYTVKRSGRNFIVEGYVDAQNSFGAMLRANWKATFTMGDTSEKEYKISNYNVTIYE